MNISKLLNQRGDTNALLSGVEFRGEFGFVTAPPWFGPQERARGVFGGHALPNCGAYDAP
jgi:hypothetical protein